MIENTENTKAAALRVSLEAIQSLLLKAEIQIIRNRPSEVFESLDQALQITTNLLETRA